jgi:hypothetical protein
VQKAFSYSFRDWERATGRKIAEDAYRRNIRKLISGEPYRRHYAKLIDLDSITYEQHVLASKRFGIPVVED